MSLDQQNPFINLAELVQDVLCFKLCFPYTIIYEMDTFSVSKRLAITVFKAYFKETLLFDISEIHFPSYI